MIDKLVLTDEEIVTVHADNKIVAERFRDDPSYQNRIFWGHDRAISLATVKKAEPLIRQDEREKITESIDDVDLPSVSDFYQDPKDVDSYVYGYNDGQEKTLDSIRQALKATVEKEVKDDR